MKQKSETDPFLLRAIEYWLDSANELGYQPLFCEWLIFKGDALKYSIKNTNFELGKDVVSINKMGKPCAYQLKGGKITLNRWRIEVRPEIEVLIDCPISHPDISKNISHISFLVTNGEIDDTVREEIMSLNSKKWKKTPLQIITRGDLLQAFQAMAYGILPTDAQMYKVLMDLMFVDGAGIPDLSKISYFLSSILNIDSVSLGKEERRRDISAALLYSTMIAGSYRKSDNYVGVIHIMALLLSNILYIVDKFELEDRYWIKTYEIIFADILSCSKLLENEVNSSNFEIITDPLERGLLPFRKHLVTSVIFAYKLSQIIGGDIDWETIITPCNNGQYKNSLVLFGEASLIPFIFLAFIIRNNSDGKVLSSGLIIKSINEILIKNNRFSKDSIIFLSPYFDVDYFVKLMYGLIDDESENNPKGSSYLLKPLIEILARQGERKYLEEVWKEISFIKFEEFIFNNPYDIYLLRNEMGDNRTSFPNKTQSWSELQNTTLLKREDGLPKSILRFPEFLPFFLCIFPFRANSELISFFR